MADVFVSFTSADREKAHWISSQLERLGHRPFVHDKELSAGGNIVRFMEERLRQADYFLCVLSPASLIARHCRDERDAAHMIRTNEGRSNFVWPVIIEDCEVPVFLGPTKRCNISGLNDTEAQARLDAYLTLIPRGHVERDASRSRSLDRADRKRFSPQRPGPLTITNLRFAEPRHFKGRDDTLQTIELALNRGDKVILSGLRGVGKSTAAGTFALRHRATYRVIWWVRAQSDADMRTDLIALGLTLRWLDEGEIELTSSIQKMINYLMQEDGFFLLIYDNAVDLNQLQPFLPPCGPSIVITTNSSAGRAIGDVVKLDPWPMSVGAEYLLERTGTTEQIASTNAERLSCALGGLPLAHAQAAAFCEHIGISLAEYGRRFDAQHSRESLLDDAGSVQNGYNLTVAKTFRLAIEAAAARHLAAKDLIFHAALLVPEPIPIFLFRDGRGRLDEPLASALEGGGLDQAVAALRAFALIERVDTPDEIDPARVTDTLSLHTLVRLIAAGSQPEDRRKHTRNNLLRAVASIGPRADEIFNDVSSWPHARLLDGIILDLVESTSEASPEVCELLDRLGTYRFKVLSAEAEGRAFYERSLKLREATQGPAHPETAISLHYLAMVPQAQGELGVARRFAERSLAIREAALGPDHALTAASLNVLGVLLQGEGELGKARRVLQRALKIREATLGPDHPDTAVSVNNLAKLLQDQRKFASARQLYDRVLSIRERAFGPSDPRTAEALNNLGNFQYAQSDFEAARRCFERALTIREKSFGVSGLETAKSLNDLAVVCQAQGDLEAARALLLRALWIRERSLPPKHPQLATSHGNLGRLLCDAGEFDEADMHLRHAIEIAGAALGSDHPHTHRYRTHFARLLLRRGDFGRALQLAQAAQKKLGPKHIWAADCANIVDEATAALADQTALTKSPPAR